MKKKVIATVLVIGTLATFGLSACGKSSSQPVSSSTATEQSVSSESTVGNNSMVNPMTSYNSMEEMVKAVGGDCNIVKPDGNVTDEAFSTLEAENGSLVAQYDFNMDDTHYTVRFCRDTTVPVSGFYTEDGEAFTQCDTSDPQFTDFAYVKNDTAFCAHWMNISGQYTLTSDASSKMNEKAFAEFAQSYCEKTIPDQKG